LEENGTAQIIVGILVFYKYDVSLGFVWPNHAETMWWLKIASSVKT